VQLVTVNVEWLLMPPPSEALPETTQLLRVSVPWLSGDVGQLVEKRSAS
jgi:hypothetical protein